MNKYAVIDLGTNTFHLLVVETQDDGRFREVLRLQRYVKLAEEGIEHIGPKPFQRGLTALQSFREQLDQMEIEDIKAFGTAGLRTAKNSQAFIQAAKAQTGIEIEVISGQREAGLIHKGVVQAIPPLKGMGLIMDIGGGSVEFIIADRERVHWAESFPIGVAVLYNVFHKSDPISEDETEKLRQFLRQTLQPLILALKAHRIERLIGASGTFDVIADQLSDFRKGDLCAQVSSDNFYPFYHRLHRSSLQERLDAPDIPNKRADMIVVAVVLIDFILQLSQASQIVVSAYAMKEGMLREMINKVLK
ncbi:MAG: phosphatase [Bacteroidota bacterium]